MHSTYELRPRYLATGGRLIAVACAGPDRGPTCAQLPSLRSIRG